jgi:hypothetical protein
MEQIKSFDEFYEVKLKPYLTDLQRQNKSAGYWGIAMFISVLLLVPGLVLGTTILGGWTITSALLLVVACVYNYTKINDAYENNFKKQVISQIIDFINPALLYKPNEHIHSSLYKHSSLFRKNYEYYEGDGLIEGSYKNVAFKCSELDVSNSGGGPDHRFIFKGLFFAAPINRKFNGGTYIWSRGVEQLPVSIADERYRLMPMPHIVKINFTNGIFEKHYSVFGTDVYEASEILTEEMMACIMDFKAQTGRNFVLSFVSGMCYVAIPFDESLLEPRSKKPGDKEGIKKYFFTILLILSIINKLQLNKLQ